MNIENQTRDMLFDRGAVKFGAFKLKLHEKNPSAPLSPFFFNIRTSNNPKPGTLTPKDCELVAGCIWKAVQKSGIDFTAACGIPNAGNPIIEALERIVPVPREFKTIPLTKETTENGRRIIPAPGYEYQKGERVLLFDDLITKADTKLESIESLEQQGCIVAGLAILIDREQGGIAELEKRGYKVISVFRATDMFQQYRDNGKINQTKFDECLTYIRYN